MTVTYSTKSFLALLLRWKGSVWKAVFPSTTVFLFVYYLVNLCYRFAMDSDQQRLFERLVVGTGQVAESIPLQYMLGFYVGCVLDRWWGHVSVIPNTVRLANTVSAFIGSTDNEDTIVLIRTITRCAFSSVVLALRNISLKVRKRFPTEKYLVSAGIWTEEDLAAYLNADGTYDRWYVPLQWSANLASKCNADGQLSDYGLCLVLEELNLVRSDIRYLNGYAKVTVPLIYTQLVTVSTLFYFSLSVIGHQSIETEKDSSLEFGFPIFILLELLCYVGWLKVGVHYLGPFGEDEDDIHIHYILDRMLAQSMFLCSAHGNQVPTPAADNYEGCAFVELAHTKLSRAAKDRPGSGDWPWLGSGNIPEKMKRIVLDAHDRVQGPWIGKGSYTKHDRHLLAPGLCNS